MNLLFVKDALNWPRSSGHDVHTYFMMQALGRIGHRVALATMRQKSESAALVGLDLKQHWHFGEDLPTSPAPSQSMPRTRLQERFRSYWGVSEEQVAWVSGIARDYNADAVIVVGLGVLPYLAAVDRAQRIWYAADEWALHHLSLISLRQPSSWKEFRVAAVKALYERVYAGLLDRVWVVSPRDARAMRWIGGARNVDVIANGVDADHYAPADVSDQPNTCTFWGRLDFAPNIDALEWFCRRVWPLVTTAVPNAEFRIYGFQPTSAVWQLESIPGVKIVANLPDLRNEVCRSQVVVLPFINGAGIKNKLLEAAALGRPIVASPLACNGITTKNLPLVTAGSPAAWSAALKRLWTDEIERRRLGLEARRWVTAHHSWPSAAKLAETSLRIRQETA